MRSPVRSPVRSDAGPARARYSAHPTTISLFFNCIFELVALTGVNGLVARWWPRRALRQGELVLIYSMPV